MTTPPVTISPPDTIERTTPVSRLTPDADFDAIQRARTGDQSAYAPLWEKYRKNLCAYFFRRVHDREEAEDLASETLLAAFDQLPAFRGSSHQRHDAAVTHLSENERALSVQQCTFQTYLYSIAHHKLAQWIRRKASRDCQAFSSLETESSAENEARSLEERLGAQPDSDPLHALLQQDRLDEVCYALVDVGMRSPEQFKALFFHYCCEFPHREVSTLLDTRSETINTRLQEGRRTLTRYYKRTVQSTPASSC